MQLLRNASNQRKQSTSLVFVPALVLIFAGVFATSLAHAAEVKETYPDGKIKARYAVDDNKRKIGVYDEYFPSGKLQLRGQFALGKKSGLWTTYDEKTGKTLESRTYRNDLLDGVSVWYLPSGNPGIKATYRLGQLYGPLMVANDRDAVIRRINYPHTRDAVEKETMALYFAQIPDPKFTTQPVVKPPYKAGVLSPQSLDDALNVTKLYRYLCGLPWQDMKVDPALSDKAGHAAVLLAKSDKPQMDLRMPEKPSDMDKAFLDIALAGCKSENLHRGTNNPIRAILEFMDNSEGKEAATLEYRQWMLSPGLQKVGIGAARRFVAMDVADGAKPSKVDFNFIAYPGEGYFPTALLDAKSNWSLFINSSKAKVPKDGAAVTVQKLDEHYQPVGEILNTQLVGTPAAASAAFGWSVIVFKPELPSMEAARYWVSVQGVQTLGGAPAPLGYIVDFIDVVVPERAIVKGPAATKPAPPTPEEMKAAKLAIFKGFLGKTVPDIQFSGRRAKEIASESDVGRTYQIDEPGDPTIIKVTTDADGKVVVVSVDGQVFK